MKSELTPIMEQYFQIKSSYKDYIFFFQIGDFFETFEEDAKIISKELELTLTTKQKTITGERTPLAGVPCDNINTYIARLIKKGYKVALCEQIEDPATSKGIVKREVTKIITPGICLEDELLETKKNNYIIACGMSNKFISLSISDISTGYFYSNIYKEDEIESVKNELINISPSEVICDDVAYKQIFSDFSIEKCYVHKENDLFGNTEENKNELERLANSVITEEYFYTINALYSYIKKINKNALKSISEIRIGIKKSYMNIDNTTISTLSLLPKENDSEITLYSLLDRTSTAMGARLLQHWIRNPLLNQKEIERRYDAVSFLTSNRELRNKIIKIMNGIFDLERISSRISAGNATPKDLANLKKSLFQIGFIKNTTESMEGTVKEIVDALIMPDQLLSLLEKSIVDFPPMNIKEGGIIKQGFSAELDSLKKIENDKISYLKDIELKEQQRTGIKNLKIGYNSVFGYYIEVTKSYLKNVPEDYIRKQTVSNAERFITKDLKEIESILLDTKERAIEMEKEIYNQIINEINKYNEAIKKDSSLLSELDALCSFSVVSEEKSYVRPVMNSESAIIIKEGRHPLVEESLKNGFIPNDTTLKQSAHRVIILTGPNMAGKTTYMRQVGIILILAQMGCFVPAKYMSYSIVNAIFTRSGSSDNITKGESSFMTEMKEVSYILRNADQNSLVLLDEIGKGTSTFDGMSIAWAIVEYLHNKIKCKAIISTHYHQLTQMSSYLPHIFNYQMAIKEEGEEIVFLRKLLPGSTDKSYGIHVAKLANIPKEVVSRSKEILSKLEKVEVSPLSKVSYTRSQYTQMLLPEGSNEEISKAIKEIELEKISPIEALLKLKQLKEMLKK
jgi:DNA mismatch repair protein MutS